MPAGTPRQQARDCDLNAILNSGFLLVKRPPKNFPEFLPSAGSRLILIQPRGMRIFPPYEAAGSNPLSEL